MRKFISLLAALSLAAALLAAPAGAVENQGDQLIPHELTEEELELLMAPELPFTDVPEDSWYYSYVLYAYTNGLFRGTTETTFTPDGNMTRAMFVTVLYRQAGVLGQDLTTGETTTFQDIQDSNAEFQTAIRWAAERSIVGGKTSETFAPREAVNRQQMCTILIRYLRDHLHCDLSAYAASNPFPDSGNISSYAAEAVNIARNMGLVKGVEVDGAVLFRPGEPASRAVVAMAVSEAVRLLPKLTANNDFNEGDAVEEPEDSGNAGVSTGVENEYVPPVQGENLDDGTSQGTTGGTSNVDTGNTSQGTTGGTSNADTGNTSQDTAGGTGSAGTGNTSQDTIGTGSAGTGNTSQDTADGTDSASDNEAGSASDASGSDTQVVHSAEELQVIQNMRNITAYYDQNPISDPDINECMALLMNTLKDTIAAHENGAVINTDYVMEHYAGEIDSFFSLYGALSSKQKSEAQTYILGMRMQDLLNVAGYFEIPVEDLL